MSNQYMPPMRASDEAKSHELDMAREQGRLYVQALKHMITHVANDGGEQRVGDYIVAYAIEDAEGMYIRQDGALQWQPPQDANIHVEISVRDGADNRFVPTLAVQATLIDPHGDEVGTHQMPLLWHPWLFHYGRNWQVLRSGAYTLRVHIAAPDLPRHDKENGQRFAEDVTVEFTDVQIKLAEES